MKWSYSILILRKNIIKPFCIAVIPLQCKLIAANISDNMHIRPIVMYMFIPTIMIIKEHMYYIDLCYKQISNHRGQIIIIFFIPHMYEWAYMEADRGVKTN